MCLWGGLVDIAPYLGDLISQNSPKWAWIDHQNKQTRKVLKLLYYRNYRVDSNQSPQNSVLRGWPKYANNESNMAEDAIKNP